MDSLDVSYKEIKTAIKKELSQIAQSFVVIGYQLKQVRDGELYKLDGYKTITEFAQAEYNLSQTSTSRFIAINDKYSMDGSSSKLLPQYEGYGFSKLSEMLTLSEEELKLVTLQTTRAEIREIKQVKKEAESINYAPAHNTESTENTQSESDFLVEKKSKIPDAEKLLIDFFREKSRRGYLKELVMLLKKQISLEDTVKISEIINPSGHLFFRSGFVMVTFEENFIKYNKFGSVTIEFTYLDLLHDIQMVFDMTVDDPAILIYGELEKEKKIEEVNNKGESHKEIPKKDESKQKIKKDEKPVSTKQTISEKNEALNKTEKKTIVEDNIKVEELPGQTRIEDFPEYMPAPVETVEAEIIIDNGQEKKKSNVYEELIHWFPVNELPDTNQYVLLALLHNKIPSVVMGHYSKTVGFKEDTYNGKDCSYQYWAYKPKSPLVETMEA